jgi:hypothetical protein
VDDGHWGVLQIAERQDLYTSVFENFIRNQLKASS